MLSFGSGIPGGICGTVSFPGIYIEDFFLIVNSVCAKQPKTLAIKITKLNTKFNFVSPRSNQKCVNSD